MIDKIVISVNSPLLLDDVTASALIHKRLLRRETLRGHRWVWTIDALSDGSFFTTHRRDGRFHVREITTRPSAFSTYYSYINKLSQLFPIEHLMTAQIKRID